VTLAAAIAAMRGERTGLVVGVSWVPASALIGLARSLELDFAFVPAEQPDAYDLVAELHALDVAAVWAVSGVFGRVAELLGWSEALRMTAGEPGALAALLAEALHAALESARAGVAAGADVVLVADDLAGASGPLLAPDFALDALLPCYHAIAAEVLGRGALAAFHSDGDVRTLMPALARSGFSAVHLAGIAPGALEVSLGAAHSAGLVAFGGVITAALAQDSADAGRLAGGQAHARGLLVCDDGGLTSAADLAGYRVAIEAAREVFGQGSARG
jgi:hypothetical protein